jgi:hypothetical protein
MTKERLIDSEESDKLAQVADEVAEEFFRYGNCKPELVRRLRSAIDVYYENTDREI